MCLSEKKHFVLYKDVHTKKCLILFDLLDLKKTCLYSSEASVWGKSSRVSESVVQNERAERERQLSKLPCPPRYETYINDFFNVSNHVLFLHTSTVEYSESDLGEWCQEPANMLGGVPRHPCGIYTPSIHSEQFFGVLGHCPTMITHLGVCLKKAHFR